MNLKDLKLPVFSKYIILATLIILIMTRTPIWQTIEAGISPIIVSLVLAYTLDYMVRFFMAKFKIPRPFAILISVIIFLALIFTLGIIVIPSIIDAVSSLIKAISNIDMKALIELTGIQNIDFDNAYLKQFQQSIIDTIAPILQKATNFTGTAVLVVVTELQKITSGIISFIVSFVIAIYMLGEKRDLLARIKRTAYAYLNDRQVHTVYYVSHLANRLFKDFVIGKFIDSTIIGFLSYFLFAIFDFEYAVLIALIVGITNMIPYFGPFIGAVPAAIITLIANPNHPIDVFYMLLLILAIQQLDGLVIGPFILGDSIGVSAFWIIVSVTVGGAAFGVLGMFLGVPACVLIKTLIEEDVHKKLSAKGYEGLETGQMKTKVTKHMRKKPS